MPAALYGADKKPDRIGELMRSPGGGPATPADIMGRLNRELSENNDDMMFVTLFLAMLDGRTGEISSCNAGHNPPYRPKGGQLGEIGEPRGIILGVRPRAVHATGRLTLAPGETIFLFTDGVTEANNHAAERFSESRLQLVLRRAGWRSSADVVGGVAAELRSFVGSAQPSDDITMLAVRKSDAAPDASS